MPVSNNQTTKLYADDITPHQAWQMLKDNDKAILVDVRTDNEWMAVGYPDLKLLDKKLVKLPWKESPYMQLNEKFADIIKETIIDKNSPILFLCRFGGRSRDAAIKIVSEGYPNCYNIIGGYEGTEANKGWIEVLPWERN